LQPDSALAVAAAAAATAAAPTVAGALEKRCLCGT